MQELRFQYVLVGAGHLVVFGLVGLSMWAVGQIQLASRPEGDPLRFWYLAAFLMFEIWVALGLVVSLTNFRSGRWGAGLVALIIWLLALGLSALQESRFHTLFDSEVDGTAALVLAERSDAQKRVVELEADYMALTKPARSIEAIRAELAGYQARLDASAFPTRITALQSELADAQAFEQAGAELVAARQVVSATAADAVISSQAKKVGQAFSAFGIDVPASATVWLLIVAMMAIKALGPWILFGVSAKRRPHQPIRNNGEDLPKSLLTSESQPTAGQKIESMEWVMIERPDRFGNIQTVRVARAVAQ